MSAPFLPRQFVATPTAHWLRALLGVLLGIGLASLICRLWLGDVAGSLPYLVAPIGASAVIVFALPASPLAQPWPVIGGNAVSALMGIFAYHLGFGPDVTAGIAVAGAVGAMALGRCLHPPGGAVALTAALGAPAIHAAGMDYAFVPVALNSAILVGLAWLFHKATGHSYPHRAKAAPAPRLPEVTTDDLAAVLHDYDDLIDVSADDLLAVLRAAEARAAARAVTP